MDTRLLPAAPSPDSLESGDSGLAWPPLSPPGRVFRLPGGLLARLEPGTAGEGGPEAWLLPPPHCSIRLSAAALSHTLLLARTPDPAPSPPDGWSTPADIEPPSAFLAALAGFASDERLRLLRFLALTCGPLFRLRRHTGWAALLHRLAAPLAASAPARPLTRPSASGLSLWQLPCADGAGPWHLLTAQRLQRLTGPMGGTLFLDGTAAGGLLLPPPDAAGAGWPIPLAAPEASLPGLLAPGPDGAPQERRLLRALARHGAGAAGEGLSHRLLRDRRLLAVPAAPRQLADPRRPLSGAAELALADGSGGVFLAGWLCDPMGLASRGLALRDPLTGVSQPVPPARLHRVARPDLAERLARHPFGGGPAEIGFLAHLPDAGRALGGAVAQWGLDLRLTSGETIELLAPPGLLAPAAARDQVLRAVHPSALRSAVLDACLIPAVDRLQRAALARLGAPEVVVIGRPDPTAGVAVVIPLYRNLRFLRFQFAAFARDRQFCADARLIFVLDSPEQRAEAEQLLRGLSAVHGLPLVLVVMSSNAGYASACNAGAAQAGAAEHLLLLNSDVVPDAPGWLAALQRPLRRTPGVLATGPKLLFEDGSVQHAGLFFARHGAEGDWLNGHYGKGMSRHHAEVQRSRRVPGVTGAALLVRHAAFRAVGGLCPDYVVGDYEDSDLCLRLRALGGDIAYVPSAELYHFERQSIAGHAGYARTLACAHNRRLHHRRWDATIEALMTRFPQRSPA